MFPKYIETKKIYVWRFIKHRHNFPNHPHVFINNLDERMNHVDDVNRHQHSLRKQQDHSKNIVINIQIIPMFL